MFCWIRLTCTICLHHPIFDTVAVLAKHRKGKKHLLGTILLISIGIGLLSKYILDFVTLILIVFLQLFTELSRYIKRKQELEYKALKEQQLDSVKALGSEMSIQSIICSRTVGGRDHKEFGRRKTLDMSIFQHKNSKLLLSKPGNLFFKKFFIKGYKLC